MTYLTPFRAGDPNSGTKQDSNNPNLPQHIRARLRIIDERALSRYKAITERIGPRQAGFDACAWAIARRPDPPHDRLRALYALVDQYMELVMPDAACSKGCSHCCHGGVAITRREAELLGAKAGVQPRRPPARDQNNNDIDWGYHNPCAFLKDGACSVYADRPLQCRIHIQIDTDATLCELVPPQTYRVPRIDGLTRAFLGALEAICGTATSDIRDFFPNQASQATRGP